MGESPTHFSVAAEPADWNSSPMADKVATHHSGMPDHPTAISH